MNVRKMVRTVAVVGLVSSLWISTGCVNVSQMAPPVIVQMPASGGNPQTLSPGQNPGQNPGQFDMTAPNGATAPAANNPVLTATGPLSNTVDPKFDPAGAQAVNANQDPTVVPAQLPLPPQTAQVPAQPPVRQFVRTFSFTVQTPRGTRTYSTTYLISSAGPAPDLNTAPGNLPS